MARHNDFGHNGELQAAKFLEGKGYTILDRNWRCGHLELDLVARIDGTLVVAEVKSRGGTEYGDPQDAVDARKIRRIVIAADAYVRLNCLDMDVRFDVLTVVTDGDCVCIEHIEDAFYPEVES